MYVRRSGAFVANVAGERWVVVRNHAGQLAVFCLCAKLAADVTNGADRIGLLVCRLLCHRYPLVTWTDAQPLLRHLEVCLILLVILFCHIY